jgi:hypothetical protein
VPTRCFSSPCSLQPHRANSPDPATHSRTWASLQARALELATSLIFFGRFDPWKSAILQS